MKLGLVLLVCLVGLAAFAVVTRQADAAVYSSACPSAPGSPDPGTITDDAIETRNQRIADVAICEAITERLAAIVAFMEAQDDATGTTAQKVALSVADRERVDRIVDTTTDARTVAAFGVGAFLASMFGVAFWRTFGRGGTG